MKKMILIVLAILVACMVAACSGAEENQTTESNEVAAEERDSGAIDVASYLGEANYLTGPWEVIYSADDQMVYNTGSCLIVLGSADQEAVVEDVTSALLENTQFAGVPAEFLEEAEEIETENITGFKRNFAIGEATGELFNFTNEDKQYCLVAVYTDFDNIAQAHAEVDQVLSSIVFNNM